MEIYKINKKFLPEDLLDSDLLKSHTKDFGQRLSIARYFKGWYSKDIFIFEDAQIEYVDEFGGEGQGYDYWVVVKDILNDKYYKCSGYYTSYDGGHLDSVLPVVPKEKTITVFEQV